ncbi:MAG: hypothetical protein P8X57_08365 [Cyclobacteriaceae bacterium]
MKTRFTLILILSCFFMISSVQAQDVQKIFYEFTSNLKPQAFKSDWKQNKEEWMSKIKDLDIATLEGTTDEMRALVANLKSSAFEKGVHKSLEEQLSTPKNAAQLATIMDEMVRGVKPDMFKDGYNPSALLQEIDKYM